MPKWFQFKKNKNSAIASQPSGKQRLSLSQIMDTGGQQSIRDLSNTLWFPAGQPIQSVAPKGTAPRRYAYDPLANINWSGRDGRVDFPVLREFSKYPIVRAIIETVKDKCCGVNWEFTLTPQDGETKKQLKQRTQDDPRIQQLNEFFRKPDGWQNFRTWSRGLFDDMLVLDAASVWFKQDEDSNIWAASQIDGSLVFPLIDESGEQPAAHATNKNRGAQGLAKDIGGVLAKERRKRIPIALRQTSDQKPSDDWVQQKETADKNGGSPAYQLTPYGYPAQQMTGDELGYYVRNRLTNTRYGYSIVEQCLAYIALGLGRLEFQAAFYKSGNVPEFIMFAPSDVPPQKVEQFQGYLDSILQGNLQNRRKGFIFPGMGQDGKPSITFPKVNDTVLKDEFDEWLARVLCYFFGVSPTSFTKAVNRATAQQAAESGEEEGLQPYIDWFRDLLNDIIQDRFGFTDIEATPQVRLEQNAQVQSEINASDFSKGLATLNEVRSRMGLDPVDADWANTNLIITGSGPVRLDGQPISQDVTLPGDTANPPKGTDGSKDQQQSQGAPAEKPSITDKNFVSDDDAEKVEKKVTNPKDIDPGDSRHKWPFSSPSKLAPISLKAQGSIESTLKACFARSKKVMGETLDKFERSEKVSKADSADDLFNRIWDIVAPEFGSIPHIVRSHLEDAARAGVSEAVEQLSAEDTGLIDSANEQAAKWAANRAAELVGKQLVNGELVDNPDAKWVISETTRQEIRDAVTQAFESETDFAALKTRILNAPGIENTFSDARASMIAKTEVAKAQMGSTFDFWKSSGLVKQVQWFTAGADPCDECQENSGEVVELGQPFPSGAITTADSHPNCNCGIFAIMGEK